LPAPGAGRPVIPARWIGFGIIGAILVVGLITSLVAGFAGGAAGSQGFHWGGPWFFFPWILIPLFFWGRWGRSGRYRSRRWYTYESDDGRRVNVYERSRGYDPYGRQAPYPPYGGYGPYGQQPQSQTPGPSPRSAARPDAPSAQGSSEQQPTDPTII
jgi:hypothetical protein